jgi:DNA repair protein RadC
MEINLTEEQRIKVLNSDSLYFVMQRILLRENEIDRNREHFWTVGLNNKNTILYIELVSLGSTCMTVVEPMQVFRIGVQKGATKMVLVHNHPSQELKPSEADKDITDRLVQSGNILQIEVIDHLIIAERTYLSFEDTGLMDQIRKSTKYVPAYELQARMKRENLAEGEEIGLKKGKKESKIEMALLMKQMGEPVEKIVAYTGLSEGEIKRLK